MFLFFLFLFFRDESGNTALFYATSRGHGHVMDFLGRICGARWIPISCARARQGTYAEGLINRLLGFTDFEQPPTRRERVQARLEEIEKRKDGKRSQLGLVPPAREPVKSEKRRARLPALAKPLIVTKGGASELLARMEPVVDLEICDEPESCPKTDREEATASSPGLSASFSLLSAQDGEDGSEDARCEDHGSSLGSEWEVVSHGSKTIDGVEWELLSPRAVSPSPLNPSSRPSTPGMNYARALVGPTTAGGASAQALPAGRQRPQGRAACPSAEGLAVELARKRVKVFADTIDEFEMIKGRALGRKSKRSNASRSQKDPRRAKTTAVLF